MWTRLRALTDDEVAAVGRLAQSRTQPARLVQRAQIIDRVRRGESFCQVAKALQIGEMTVSRWVRRFNEAGITGFVEHPRSGRPPTYTPENVGLVIEIALTKPAAVDQPFGSWTLDRLATYLQEERGIRMKRSRISELLRAEGLRWRTQETWFGERVDPEFAAKRGRLSRSTPNHR